MDKRLMMRRVTRNRSPASPLWRLDICFNKKLNLCKCFLIEGLIDVV